MDVFLECTYVFYLFYKHNNSEAPYTDDKGFFILFLKIENIMVVFLM